jgi:hypothetical protein
MRDKFQEAMRLIDAAHAADPVTIEVEGVKRPGALVHAERRTYWIERLLGPNASEALRLAGRAQHIRRWQIPRERYPRERIGYLTWRTELKKFHAEKTAEILRSVGYDEAMIERVASLIQKKQLKQDPEAQAMEDALCLVFLESQFSEFSKKEADKIEDILRKTWQKMSAQGRQLAHQLPFSREDQAILAAALSEPG